MLKFRDFTAKTTFIKWSVTDDYASYFDWNVRDDSELRMAY